MPEDRKNGGYGLVNHPRAGLCDVGRDGIEIRCSNPATIESGRAVLSATLEVHWWISGVVVDLGRSGGLRASHPTNSLGIGNVLQIRSTQQPHSSCQYVDSRPQPYTLIPPLVT